MDEQCSFLSVVRTFMRVEIGIREASMTGANDWQVNITFPLFKSDISQHIPARWEKNTLIFWLSYLMISSKKLLNGIDFEN
jgi:hypothetical protein